MAEQIDGKHHFLRQNATGNWEVVRKADGKAIDESGDGSAMVEYMRSYDAHADHFIQKGREQAADDFERLATSVGVFDVAANVDVEGGGAVDWIAVRPRIETDDAVFEQVTVESTSFATALQLLANVARFEADRA